MKQEARKEYIRDSFLLFMMTFSGSRCVFNVLDIANFAIPMCADVSDGLLEDNRSILKVTISSFPVWYRFTLAMRSFCEANVKSVEVRNAILTANLNSHSEIFNQSKKNSLDELSQQTFGKNKRQKYSRIFLVERLLFLEGLGTILVGSNYKSRYNSILIVSRSDFPKTRSDNIDDRC